jgi:hypothetical protein
MIRGISGRSWLGAHVTLCGGVARACRDRAASVLAMWLSLNSRSVQGGSRFR